MVASFLIGVAAALLSGDAGEIIWGCAVAAVFALVLPLVHSLTVRVSRTAIVLAFGIGLIRKRFGLADIQSAEIVKNHWSNGWGIKLIRGGWLFNVSGFDAVEIKLKNGRKYRIGTDQPRELLAAIETRRPAR